MKTYTHLYLQDIAPELVQIESVEDVLAPDLPTNGAYIYTHTHTHYAHAYTPTSTPTNTHTHQHTNANTYIEIILTSNLLKNSVYLFLSLSLFL